MSDSKTIKWGDIEENDHKNPDLKFEAIIDDGSCEYPQTDIEGCTDSEAINYNSDATLDDGSCEYEVEPEECLPMMYDAFWTYSEQT